MKKKVMIVFGTRPEAIKMAPLVKELKERTEDFETTVVVTAQHREMLDQVLETFSITPDYDLNIMEKNQTLLTVTTNALNKLDAVVKEVEPDIVLVHGDTTTTFVGALAAFYNQVKIGHVEAGLRTYDKYSPYPEEMNRQLTGVMADFHFCPTEKSKHNLTKEGKESKNIYVTGNTAIDALKMTVRGDYHNELLNKKENEKIILMTTHRRENLGEPMKHIFGAINEILQKEKNVKIIFPMHMNPKIKELADKYLKADPRIHIIKPLDVLDFHNFAERSDLILTDSGGIQEEAPSLGKPVLVLRDNTERPEGVAAGTLLLVGTDKDKIVKETLNLLNNRKDYEKMAKAENPYGDGMTSKRIADILKEEL